MWNVVLQQAVHRDDVLAEELDVLSDPALSDLAVMGDDLQGKAVRRHAGSALAEALRLIEPQMAMEAGEHLLDLLEELLCGRRSAESVEQNGIALHFGHLQADVIRRYQFFQQLFDDVAAVCDFRGLHELREAADIGNEQQRWLGSVRGLE
jgi:hypothetical protein